MSGGEISYCRRRTHAFWKTRGALQSKTVMELGGIAVKEALKRSGVNPEDVDEVIMGSVLQGGQGRYRRGRPRVLRDSRGTSKRKRLIKCALQV